MAEDLVRHHTVPAVYLRNFASQNSLRTTDVENPQRSWKRPPNTTGMIKHFHTIEVNGGKSKAFEKYLSKVEGAYASAYRALRHNQWRPPPAGSLHRLRLAEFVASQLLRTTAIRRDIEDIYTTAAMNAAKSGETALMDWAKEAFGSVSAEFRANAMKRFEADDFRIHGRVPHLAMMYKYIEPAGKILLEGNWIIAEFPLGGLITSDNPVAVEANPAGTRLQDGFPVPLHVTIPLDKHHQLAIADPASSAIPEGLVAIAPSSTLDDTNHVTWAVADKFVYSDPLAPAPSFPAKALGDRHFGSSQFARWLLDELRVPGTDEAALSAANDSPSQS